MSRQRKTGEITESWVRDEINKFGLASFKPVPDRGVDLVVLSKENQNREVKLQVKGRGEIQSNHRYRWFQIRTTPKQREETVNGNLPLSEAWRKKVAKAEIFIFVSLKFHEFWIFESKDIENLIRLTQIKYGHRKDNIDGSQAEIDLDIDANGILLREMYHQNLNNWSLITNKFQ